MVRDGKTNFLLTILNHANFKKACEFLFLKLAGSAELTSSQCTVEIENKNNSLLHAFFFDSDSEPNFDKTFKFFGIFHIGYSVSKYYLDKSFDSDKLINAVNSVIFQIIRNKIFHAIFAFCDFSSNHYNRCKI